MAARFFAAPPAVRLRPLLEAIQRHPIDANANNFWRSDELGTDELENKFGTNIDAKMRAMELENKFGTNIDAKMGTVE
ncbi:hypothetical protein niasHT_019814 [Heterodera trifolii]|uniref:Uncharacterized protein n=1 Tax=Heterodera trifolii TaxID=157864 RepID=A0ABD2KUW0_9BILA